MTTETLNRRQRIDAGEAGLAGAYSALGDAEAREMRLTAELELARQRTIDATKALDAARIALAEAHAFVEPTRALDRPEPAIVADAFANGGDGLHQPVS